MLFVLTEVQPLDSKLQAWGVDIVLGCQQALPWAKVKHHISWGDLKRAGQSAIRTSRLGFALDMHKHVCYVFKLR